MDARRVTRLWAIEVAVKGTAGLSDRTDLSRAEAHRAERHRRAMHDLVHRAVSSNSTMT
jgi:hypothetical protein